MLMTMMTRALQLAQKCFAVIISSLPHLEGNQGGEKVSIILIHLDNTQII